MNPNDNNIDYTFYNGVLYDSNGNPIVKIASLGVDNLSDTNPVPIITSPEEFSCTVHLSDEGEASLWACCEGLEIEDGGNNNDY
jgi:hypothetical protein